MSSLPRPHTYWSRPSTSRTPRQSLSLSPPWPQRAGARASPVTLRLLPCSAPSVWTLSQASGAEVSFAVSVKIFGEILVVWIEYISLFSGWFYKIFYFYVLFAGIQLVSTVCGHVFCQRCLRQCLLSQQQCPTCRKRISQDGFHPLFL